MRGSTSPSKQVVKFSIMPLASRRLDGETDGTTINQQSAPRSCVNPADYPSFGHQPVRPLQRGGGFSVGEALAGHHRCGQGDLDVELKLMALARFRQPIQQTEASA